MNRPLLTRRTAAALARAGAAGSAVMLALAVVALSPGEARPAGAAGTQVGTAAVITPDDGSPAGGDPLTGGNSETPFSLFLGSDPTCPGDSANGGYTVASFMVGSNVDVAGLQFDPASGPTPVLTTDDHDTLRLPLFQVAGGAFYMGAQTADANPPGGPGPIVNIPALVFAAPAGITAGDVPPGNYKIGVGCIKGAASATQLSSFWVAEIAVTAAPTGGGAAQFTWSVLGGSSTTTTVGGATTSTTTSGGSTSTTVGGSSTSTTSAGATSTSVGGASTTSTAAAGGSTTGGVSGSGGSLPTTGSSPAALAMWGFFLVVCGRMAIVLSRPPKVRTPRA